MSFVLTGIGFLQDSGTLVLIGNPVPEANSEAPKWSAREETRLLDAIEQYGFGNWQDISKHIESKTPAGNFNTKIL